MPEPRLVGRFFGLFVVLLLSSHSLRAQSTADSMEFFETKIRPVLSEHCFACHGPKMQTAGLDLSTKAGFFKGGENGPVVIKGDPENSRLIHAVGYQDKIKMPPSGRLTEQQISNLTAWVKSGASWPDEKSLPSSLPVSE